MSERKLMPLARSLAAARDRIADKENWWQGRFEHNGRRCAVGALPSPCAYTSIFNTREFHFLEAAAVKLYGEHIVHVNDCFGHDQVMKCYAHAIQAADAWERSAQNA
jgi:hypothetical protein